MEVICKRIPVLAGKVFKNLSDQDLIKCKESSREFCFFLNEEQFFAKRIINSNHGNFIQYEDVWNKVTKEAPKEIIVKLAIAVQEFFIGDESRFGKQWSPFWIAAERGDSNLLKEIFEISGSISKDGSNGLNALLFMVAKNGHTDVSRLIIDKLENKNPSESNGWTPFHDSAKHGHVDICRVLMNNLADKNPGDNGGWTPLHSAAENGKLEVCKIILFANIEKNPKTTCANGDTVLHVAAGWGHLDIYKLISKYVNDKNPANNNGAAPLHLASQAGHLAICNYIVEKIGNVDTANNLGQTPLLLAAGFGHLEVCKFFIEKGMKKDVRDINGWTPLHHAAYNGHVEVCKLISAMVHDKHPRSNYGETPYSMMTAFLLRKVFI